MALEQKVRWSFTIKATLLSAAISLGSLLYAPQTSSAEETKPTEKIEQSVTKFDENPLKITETDIQFIKSLNLGKLDRYLQNVKYTTSLPEFRERYSKSASKENLSTPELEEIIRLMGLRYKCELNQSISEESQFKTDVTIAWKRRASIWDKDNYTLFISKIAYLIEDLTDYNYFIAINDDGLGDDINKDGRFDGIRKRFLEEVESELKAKIIKEPDKYRELSLIEKRKANSEPLDKLLREAIQKNQQLSVVCSHKTVLAKSMYDLLKGQYPYMQNIHFGYDERPEHIWNLVFAVTPKDTIALALDVTAIETHSTYQGFWLKKGAVYDAASYVFWMGNKPEEIIRLLEPYLKDKSASDLSEDIKGRLFNMLAAVYSLKGDMTQAKKYSSPTANEISDWEFYQRAKVNMDNKDYNEAIKNYSIILRDFFKGRFADEALVNIGNCYYRLGDFKKSKALSLYGLRINPRYQDETLLTLAASYYKLNELDDASATYNRLAAFKQYDGTPTEYKEYAEEMIKYIESVNRLYFQRRSIFPIRPEENFDFKKCLESIVGY